MRTRMASCPPLSLLPTRFVLSENKNDKASTKRKYNYLDLQAKAAATEEKLWMRGHVVGETDGTFTCAYQTIVNDKEKKIAEYKEKEE